MKKLSPMESVLKLAVGVGILFEALHGIITAVEDGSFSTALNAVTEESRLQTDNNQNVKMPIEPNLSVAQINQEFDKYNQ